MRTTGTVITGLALAQRSLAATTTPVAPATAAVTLPTGFSLGYGTLGENLASCGTDCWKFTLTPPAQAGNAAAGALIASDDYGLAGSFCATISIDETVSGTVFAMYTTSGEPIDRSTEVWDELDLEFTSKEPEAVWANAFHAGSQTDADGANIGNYVDLGGRSDNQGGAQWNTYCMEWDTTSEAPLATWTRNGDTIKTLDLTGWAKPMQAVISYWSTACTGEEGCDFTGPLELSAPSSVSVKGIEWFNADPAPMADRDTYPVA